MLITLSCKDRKCTVALVAVMVVVDSNVGYIECLFIIKRKRERSLGCERNAYIFLDLLISSGISCKGSKITNSVSYENYS